MARAVGVLAACLWATLASATALIMTEYSFGAYGQGGVGLSEPGVSLTVFARRVARLRPSPLPRLQPHLGSCSLRVVVALRGTCVLCGDPAPVWWGPARCSTAWTRSWALCKVPLDSK